MDTATDSNWLTFKLQKLIYSEKEHREEYKGITATQRDNIHESVQ